VLLDVSCCSKASKECSPIAREVIPVGLNWIGSGMKDFATNYDYSIT